MDIIFLSGLHYPELRFQVFGNTQHSFNGGGSIEHLIDGDNKEKNPG